jgi:endonuclease/exonuclease/phosphatase family metal-dependent hydrolase
MSYYFAKARRHAGLGQYGNALLVRGRIDDVTVVVLAGDHRHVLNVGGLTIKPFREPRNAIVATVTVAGWRISVATGHFATDPSARRPQLNRVAETLAARPAPRLLLGDFNIPWRRAADWLAPHGLKLAEALLEPARPELRKGIDHVAVDGLAVHDVATRWLAISDHPVKIVEVTI